MSIDITKKPIIELLHRLQGLQYFEKVTSDYTVEHARMGYYVTLMVGRLVDDRYVRKDGTVWASMDDNNGEAGGTYFSTKEEAESLLASLLGAQK